MTYAESCNNLPDSLKIQNFNYNGTNGTDGSGQTWTAPCTGIFKLEAWGAQGGMEYYFKSYAGGKGGYVSANVRVRTGDTIYVYVGAKGKDRATRVDGANAFNGGGIGRMDNNGDDAGGDGGGATDFRIIGGAWNDATSLKSRILVAGGGGGAASARADCDANVGGNLVKTGETGCGYEGSNTWLQGQFGYGSDGNSTVEGGGGSGGGYYGGGVSMISSHAGSGFGGTSYISGYSGTYGTADTTYLSYQKINGSNLTFSNVTMIQGNNAGMGKAKITFVSS